MATQAVRVLKEPTQIERAALFERWMAKVDRSGGNKACWVWRGAKSKKRNGLRGVIRVGGVSGRIMSAARVGKILASGAKFTDPEIALLEICHVRCSNGGKDVDCVNPNHTEWGTRVENEQQKRLSQRALAARWKGKARRAKGQKHKSKAR